MHISQEQADKFVREFYRDRTGQRLGQAFYNKFNLHNHPSRDENDFDNLFYVEENYRVAEIVQEYFGVVI